MRAPTLIGGGRPLPDDTDWDTFRRTITGLARALNGTTDPARLMGGALGARLRATPGWLSHLPRATALELPGAQQLVSWVSALRPGRPPYGSPTPPARTSRGASWVAHSGDLALVRLELLSRRDGLGLRAIAAHGAAPDLVAQWVRADLDELLGTARDASHSPDHPGNPGRRAPSARAQRHGWTRDAVLRQLCQVTQLRALAEEWLLTHPDPAYRADGVRLGLPAAGRMEAHVSREPSPDVLVVLMRRPDLPSAVREYLATAIRRTEAAVQDDDVASQAARIARRSIPGATVRPLTDLLLTDATARTPVIATPGLGLAPTVRVVEVAGILAHAVRLSLDHARLILDYLDYAAVGGVRSALFPDRWPSPAPLSSPDSAPAPGTEASDWAMDTWTRLLGDPGASLRGRLLLTQGLVTDLRVLAPLPGAPALVAAMLGVLTDPQVVTSAHARQTLDHLRPQLAGIPWHALSAGARAALLQRLPRALRLDLLPLFAPPVLPPRLPPGRARAL